ncbi:MAG: ABC transporter ATP-binding protein [Phycisphaerales bacterium]|nr:ABC transporter ATP-binding protein [Phycisphaerales bacterium]
MMHALGSKLRRFVSGYVWVAREGARGRWLVVALAIAALFVSAGAQGGAISALLSFTRRVERPGADGGLLHNDIWSLLLVAGAFVALLALSAVTSYYSAAQARRIARRLHRASARRVLALATNRPRLDRSTATGTIQEARALVSQASRLMGVSFESLLRLIDPLSNLVVYVVSLFLLNPLVATFVLPLFVLPLPFLHLLNVRVRQASHTYYGGGSRGMSTTTSEVLQTSNASNLGSAPLREALGASFDASEGVDEYFDTFDRLRLASNRSVLITSLFRPVALVIILIAMGYQAIDHQISWPSVMTFLFVVLRIVNQTESMASHFATLNRFYPQIMRYRTFVEALERTRDDEREELARPTSLRLDGGEAGTVTLTAGALVRLLQPESLLLFNIMAVTAGVRAATRPRRAAVAWVDAALMQSRFAPTGFTLAALLTGERAPDAPACDRAADWLREAGVLDEATALDPAGVSAVLTASWWSAASPHLGAAARILPLMSTPRGPTLIDERILRGTDPAWASSLLARLSDRIVVLVPQQANVMVSALPVTTMLVSTGSTLRFAGSWASWMALEPEVRKAMIAEATATGGTDESSSDDDLDADAD